MSRWTEALLFMFCMNLGVMVLSSVTFGGVQIIPGQSGFNMVVNYSTLLLAGVSIIGAYTTANSAFAFVFVAWGVLSIFTNILGNGIIYNMIYGFPTYVASLGAPPIIQVVFNSLWGIIFLLFALDLMTGGRVDSG